MKYYKKVSKFHKRFNIQSCVSLILLYIWWACSSVCIETELRGWRSGTESRWWRDIPHFQTGAGAHPASYKMGTGSLPGVKCGRGVLLTAHPLLVPRSWKNRTIRLLTLWTVRPVQSLSACTVQLYLYSPYGPYGLYRTSVPVQYSYTSTPPMDRTTCTESKCLYKGALFLCLSKELHYQ